MPQEIVIIGALPADPPRKELIDKLIAREPHISWRWVQAPAESSLPPSNQRQKLLNQLRNPGDKKFTVVMLPSLDGRVQNEIYRVTRSVVHVHSDPQTIDNLVSWVFSPDANLVPRSEWFVNAEEAAFLAVLSKLIRKKYWNKDQHGHEWLNEKKLMNQTPVNDPDRGKIRIAAKKLLPKLEALQILLTKGSEGGGGTAKEWSLNTAFLPEIKQAITLASFDPLLDITGIQDFIFSIIESSDIRDINALDKIINSTTLQNCRESDGEGKSGC